MPDIAQLCTELVSCSREAETTMARARFVYRVQSCRLYSTKMLRVLLRAGTPGFSTWGVELLVTQLYDQSPAVTSAALTILDEACDIEVCSFIFMAGVGSVCEIMIFTVIANS